MIKDAKGFKTTEIAAKQTLADAAAAAVALSGYAQRFQMTSLAYYLWHDSRMLYHAQCSVQMFLADIRDNSPDLHEPVSSEDVIDLAIARIF